MTIYDRIRKIRTEKGISQSELARLVGYQGKSAVSKVEQGERDISQSMIVKYANALGVSPMYLLLGDENISNDLFGKYELMHIQTKRIHLLGEIACGEPIYAAEDFESYVWCGSDVKADFALRCKGDSMIGARINDGDIVFIRKQDDVENGEIAAVIIEGEATLKRVYKAIDTITLSAENPTFQPLVYTKERLDQVYIIGKAIAFQSDVK